MRTPSCRLEYLVPSRVSDASNDDRLGSVIYQSATLPVAGGAGFMGVTTPVVGIGGVTGVCLVVFAEAMMLTDGLVG